MTEPTLIVEEGFEYDPAAPIKFTTDSSEIIICERSKTMTNRIYCFSVNGQAYGLYVDNVAGSYLTYVLKKPRGYHKRALQGQGGKSFNGSRQKWEQALGHINRALELYRKKKQPPPWDQPVPQEHQPWANPVPQENRPWKEPVQTFDPLQHQPQTKEPDMSHDTHEMITIMQLQRGAKLVSVVELNSPPQQIPPQQIPPHQMHVPQMPPQQMPPQPQPQSRVHYYYKNVLKLSLEAGDLVVCETAAQHKLFEVVDPNVRATDVQCGLGNLKHVMAKVRNDDYLEAKATEERIFHKLALSAVTSRLTTFREQVGDEAYNTVSNLLDDDSGNESDSSPFGS